jgi:LCP family protein required for cell wall assembly
MYDGLKHLEIPRRPRKKRPRRLLRTVGIFALCFVVVGGGGLFYVYQKVQANLREGVIDKPLGLDLPLPDQALNILVLGSDRRDVIEGRGGRGQRQFQGGDGQRADVMILVHIAKEAKNAVMVSLPRDLRVEIPGYGTDKLNAAYSVGGAKLTIQTVKQFTGMNIHHFVEINFASFQDIVDTLGGVKIYVDRPLQDERSGLDIPEAGCIKMDGEVALSYVRARYIDPTADLGRIERQQLFIRTLLRKVKSLGFLLNPFKWTGLSEVIGKGVRYDKGVDLNLARGVANKLAGSDEDVDFRIVPNFPEYIGGISYLIPVEYQARLLFNAIKKDKDLPPYGRTGQTLPEPEDVSVQILNASGRKGLATQEQKRLGKVGFEVPSVGNSDTIEAQTIVEFEFGDQLMAKIVSRRYPDSITRLVDDIDSTDVRLLVGLDHAQRIAARDGESPTPTPSGVRSSPPPTRPTVDPEKARCA